MMGIGQFLSSTGSSDSSSTNSEELGISAFLPPHSPMMENRSNIAVAVEMMKTDSAVGGNDDILTFCFSDERVKGDGSASADVTIKLFQSQANDVEQANNETNTGFVLWPAAQILAHHLVNKSSHLVLGTDDDLEGNILELGAGCGLVGLTVAKMLKQDSDDIVILTDYNKEVLDNINRNAVLNDISSSTRVIGLDWFDQCPTGSNTWTDMKGNSHAQCRLIVGAELIVCSNDAELVATTIDRALMEGGTAVLISPTYQRFGVSLLEEACLTVGLTCNTEETDETELLKQLNTGIKQGHEIKHYSTFTIKKPLAGQ